VGTQIVHQAWPTPGKGGNGLYGCIREYIVLGSGQLRAGKDPRTIGNLFYVSCDELRDISLLESLQKILTLLKQALQSRFQLAEQETKSLIDYFISGLPTFLKERLAFCRCES
jgi:hypothetical protein